MAEAKIYMPDTLDAMLREYAMKRFGYGRGSISKAAEEAINRWVYRENRIDTVIKRIVEKAKSDKDVIAVLLFGSYARKEPNYNDVDVALLLSHNEKAGERVLEYSGLFGSNDDRLFDITIVNSMPIDMQSRILSEGIPVYVRDQNALDRYNYSVLLEWEDFKPVFNLIAGR